MALGPLYPKKTKDPDAALDYKFAWGEAHQGESPWLQPGETIASAEVTVSPVGLSLDSDEITDSATSVTFWVSGGSVGTSYTARCRIVTNASRTDVRSMTIVVQNR